MRKLRANRSGVIYIFATIIVFMFIVALAWFMLSMAMQPISAAITPIATSYHNSTWTMYEPLSLATQFMDYFWQFLLLFAMFGLALWVWMYSQHRGQPY